MQRLVFICPDVMGGVASYVKNLSEFLTRKGIDHAVLCYGWHKGLTTIKTKEELSHYTHLRFSQYGSLRSAYLNLAGCIQKDDLVICNDSLELEAINHLQIRNRVVFMLHGDLEHYAGLLKKFHTIIDKVFCVSQGLAKKYGLLYPTLSFEVCHPLVKDFAGPLKQGSVKQGSGPLLFGIFVGRFEYMKGADVFIEVVQEAAKKQVPIRWKAFASSKGSEEALMAKIPEQVEIAYDLANEKVLAAMEEADLLLFPSRSEGFGIVVLEAMKRGVVPIARNLPIGIPDMIVDGETGYLADHAEEILDIIMGLNLDKAKLRKMGLQASRFAHETFSYEKAGGNFVVHAEELMKQPIKVKPFVSVKERITEKFLPEPVYRFSKWLHNTIKYGRRASAFC